MFLFALVGNTTYVARYAATLYNLFISKYIYVTYTFENNKEKVYMKVS
jgi:hypothetical protein